MDLAVCAIVVALGSLQSASATPHGYGVKNGAAAQAVAGAFAGAYSGAPGLPTSLPHGAGFSGSFSKSASSSFSSSSASSSSSSFSFSGTGLPGAVGGCTTGICKNGDSSGLHSPNGNLNGFHSNNGASSLAGAQAGAIAGSYNKGATSPPCSGGSCPNQNSDGCKGPSCSGVSNSEDECASGQCGSTSSSEPSTYNYGSNDNSEGTNVNNNLNSEDGNKCTSGNCGTTSPGLDSSSSNHKPTNNCAGGQCGSSSGSGEPTTYGSANYPTSPNKKCTSGQCGSSSDAAREPAAFGSSTYPSKSNEKCSSGQCRPTSDGTIPTENGENGFPKNPSEKCTSGQCNLDSGNVPPAYGGNGYSNSLNKKCITGQCATSPANDYSSPNYDSDNKNEKCTSGQCKPQSKKQPEASTQYQSPYDIHINVASTSTVKPANYPSYNHINTPRSPTQSSPGCSFGNCGPVPALNPTPTFPQNPTNTYFSSSYSNQKPSNCNSPDCNNGVYNPHASAPESTLVPAFKPVTYLTAPKHDSSCTSPHCQSPGSYPSGSVIPTNGATPTVPSNTHNPGCTNGFCANTQSHSVPQIPNEPNSEYKPSGIKCTSPHCYTNNHNVPSNTPQNFGSSGTAIYNPSNIPHGSNLATTPSQGNNPSPNLSDGHYYPTGQPLPQSAVSNFNPIQQPTSSNAPALHKPKEDDSIPPFVPLTPPGNCGGSSCPGNTFKQPSYGQNSISYPSIPSGHFIPPSSSNYPGTYNNGVPKVDAKNSEKPYQGGFGAPSGLLKPNEYTIPSSIPTTNNKPTETTGHPSNPVQCTSPNCNTQSYQPHQGQSEPSNTIGKPQGTHNSASCSTGNCGLPNSQTGTYNLNGANAAANAVASATADAVAYTGGFGGPPGLLKPFDEKTTGVSTGFSGKNPANVPGLNSHSPTSGVHNTAGNGGLTGATAQSGAVAGASAGAFVGSNYGHGANSGHGSTTGGCGGGCNGGGSYGSGKSLDIHAGHPKGGYQDDLYGGLSAAGAGAKAVSFGSASSFASAHASAGAATKGGYGRR